jgi:hypothetical protein
MKERWRKGVTGRRGKRRKLLLDDLSGNQILLEIERGRKRSQSVDSSPWKRLWICCKTDYVTSRCHCMKNWASAVTGGQ